MDLKNISQTNPFTKNLAKNTITQIKKNYK